MFLRVDYLKFFFFIKTRKICYLPNENKYIRHLNKLQSFKNHLEITETLSQNLSKNNPNFFKNIYFKEIYSRY